MLGLLADCGPGVASSLWSRTEIGRLGAHWLEAGWQDGGGFQIQLQLLMNCVFPDLPQQPIASLAK